MMQESSVARVSRKRLKMAKRLRGRLLKWVIHLVHLAERRKQMGKPEVCEGGVFFHRWMTKRKGREKDGGLEADETGNTRTGTNGWLEIKRQMPSWLRNRFL